jgi:hypothetical protein
VQDAEDGGDVFRPLVLLGLLSNYNKFEHRNPYRFRMEDFVNEAVSQKLVQGLGKLCASSRDQYAAIVQDHPDQSWTLSNALNSIGLGILAPIKAINPIAPADDDTKERFAALLVHNEHFAPATILTRFTDQIETPRPCLEFMILRTRIRCFVSISCPTHLARKRMGLISVPSSPSRRM